MKIGIASDHRGLFLKTKLIKYLIKKKYEVIDYGTNSNESVDYPQFGFRLGEAVVTKEVDFGIAICGSGIGIYIACNKVEGVRCAKVDQPKEAIATRKDNDANILAINGSMPVFKALDIVDAFFKTDFSNEPRHQRRIDQIHAYEKEKNKVEQKEKVESKEEQQPVSYENFIEVEVTREGTEDER